jgi:hypothetical protein
MSQPVDQEPVEQTREIVPILQPDDDLPEITPYEVNSTEPRTRPTGCFWILGGLTGCLLCPLIILAVPVLLGFTSVNGLLGGIQNGIVSVVHPPPPAASITTTSQTIVQSVLPLGQLVSISVQMAKPDITVGVRQGTLNACGYAASHVVSGSVDAGVDLTQFTPDDVIFDAKANKYIITLPAPEITSCRIESSRQYDRTTTACNVDWDATRIIAEGVALQSFRQDALEGGILTRAQNEASVTIGAFIHGLTGKDVEIHFTAPPSDPELPPSCSRDLPPGWVYDQSTGSWTER